MSRVVVQSYLALGGPLHGLEVTEQYAGDDYIRYNSAGGASQNYKRITLPSGGRALIRIKGSYSNPRCVLVYFPSQTDWRETWRLNPPS